MNIAPPNYRSSGAPGINFETLIFEGHVKEDSEETVTFTFDMEKKELQMKPSWNHKVKQLLARSKRVCPHFWSDCDERKLTVSRSDDWRFIKY